MSLADTRSPATAMRDLLRRIDRAANKYSPARPTAPPAAPFMLAAAPAPAPAPAAVVVGQWRLHQDPETGDLMATDPDGIVHVLLRKGGS